MRTNIISVAVLAYFAAAQKESLDKEAKDGITDDYDYEAMMDRMKTNTGLDSAGPGSWDLMEDDVTTQDFDYDAMNERMDTNTGLDSAGPGNWDESRPEKLCSDEFGCHNDTNKENESSGMEDIWNELFDSASNLTSLTAVIIGSAAVMQTIF